jgi:hypothetical protein
MERHLATVQKTILPTAVDLAIAERGLPSDNTEKGTPEIETIVATQGSDKESNVSDLQPGVALAKAANHILTTDS